jgi:hypothetical protein
LQGGDPFIDLPGVRVGRGHRIQAGWEAQPARQAPARMVICVE